MEFRVAPDAGYLGKADVDSYLGGLAVDGPMAGRDRGDELVWLEIKEGVKFKQPITGEYDGRKYLLLHLL